MIEKSKILTAIGIIATVVISVYGIHQLYIQHEANRIENFRKHAGFYVLKQEVESTQDGGFIGFLSWIPGKKEQEEPLSPVIRELKVIFKVDGKNECQFKITDAEDSRFQLPYNEPFPFTKEQEQKSKQQRIFDYKVSKVGEQFFFELFRKSSGQTIFSTKDRPILFTDKYLEISTEMNEEIIFGLGDRRTDFQIKSGRYSFWNADAMWIDNGTPGKSIYGYHPMYLRREVIENNFHVTLFRNTYGLQVDYKQNQYLTYKTIGGNLDFKFFLGNSNPENAIKLYHNYVNGWILHPFWAQGFHQCRWGYKSSDQLMEVWDKYNSLQIPIDSLWSDIDYMYEYQDFTIDTERFNLTQMHAIYNLSNPQGVHWSSIIDVGISIEEEGAIRGQEMNIFIQSAKTKDPIIGTVWPGKTYFPDFNHPNSTEYWYEGFVNLTKYGLQQDGIWIDMNEYSNFVTGEVGKDESTFINEIKAFFTTEKPNLPFNPLEVRRLDHRTLSLDATHYSGDQAVLVNATKNYTITQYDMHNINGFGEGLATYKAAKRLGKKLTFILSRSSMFGSGRYVQHWNGDAFSTWEYLRLIIPSIMNFQMYGIPFVGDDICGLALDATAELCARWQQLGSLYPFSRNHNGDKYSPQEPYAFPKHPYVLSSTIKTLSIRYQLLKFYYHLFVKGNGLGTVFRPLFWEFPGDEQSYQHQFQFMLGDYLLASPVVNSGNIFTQKTKHCVYIPENSLFFDFYNYNPIQGGDHCFQVPFDAVVPMYIKSGKIVHLQDRKNTLRSRFLDNRFTLLIALDENNQSSGSILTIDNYNEDDNIIQNCTEQQNCVANLSANISQKSGNQLNIEIKVNQAVSNTNFQEIIVDKLIVVGIKRSESYKFKIIDMINNPFIINKEGSELNLFFEL
ncbi:hypothetical protein ABPG72_021969 [Tetrahymena utriculariae]